MIPNKDSIIELEALFQKGTNVFFFSALCRALGLAGSKIQMLIACVKDWARDRPSWDMCPGHSQK